MGNTDDVRLRLEEAMRTLRRLPLGWKDIPVGYRCAMPDVVRSIHDAYGWYGDPGYPPGAKPENQMIRKAAFPPSPGLGPPTADSVTRLDECLDWLMWLDARTRGVVAVKAAVPRAPFWMIGQRYGVSGRTVRRWRAQGLAAIAERVEKKVLA